MARRGQGEGSIYKRVDGRWTAAISVGGRKRKTFYGKTRRDVQKALTAALRDQEQGLPIVVERQTVAQFLDRWLAEVVAPNLRPKTHASYSQMIRLHIRPKLGHHQLQKLAPQHVQAAMNGWSSSGLSPRTVQYLRAILRRALSQALKWNLVTRNVATLVDPPKYRRPQVQVFTPEQVSTFLTAIKDDDLEALYLVALGMGLREGEVLGLSWADVDFETGTLRVRKALQRIGKKLVLAETKTDRSRRTLKMPDTVATALKGHRARQLELRLAAGPEWQERDFVFTTRKGTPLEPRNVVRSFHRLLGNAKLPKIRFHDLRHSCASLLLAQGVAPRTIMEILGHSEIRLTMDTYAHVMPTLLESAMSEMDKALRRS